MPARDLDAVFYAANVPDVAYRDGMFHVCYGIRNCYFEFVMAPHVFERALILAEGAKAQFQVEQLGGNITPIRKRKK